MQAYKYSLLYEKNKKNRHAARTAAPSALSIPALKGEVLRATLIKTGLKYWNIRTKKTMICMI